MEICLRQEVRVYSGEHKGLTGPVREIWSKAPGGEPEVVLAAKGGFLVSVPVTCLSVESLEPIKRPKRKRPKAATKPDTSPVVRRRKRPGSVVPA